MIHFFLAHGWHLLGLGPIILILACIFAWPVVGPIIAAKPWIAAVALALLAAYAQQWRIVILKHELETAKTKGKAAEAEAFKATSDWQACTGAAAIQSAAVQRLENQGKALAGQVATATAAAAAARAANSARTVTIIRDRPVPSDCPGAVKAMVPIWNDLGHSFQEIP